mgnify:CR=1 FL=1
MGHLEREQVVGRGYSPSKLMDAVLEEDEPEIVMDNDMEEIPEICFAVGDVERPSTADYRIIRGLLDKELDHSLPNSIYNDPRHISFLETYE